MMCYRDRTWCDYWTQCAKGDTCYRALTLELEEHAKEINLPVCYFNSKPECFEESK